jgi:SAM-dependent methyltransferase
VRAKLSRRLALRSSEPSPKLIEWQLLLPSRELPVLDAGCGFGQNARYLRRLGFTVVGADIDLSRLSTHREAESDAGSSTNPAAVCMDLSGVAIPFPAQTFGLIILIHFRPETLGALARTLAPAGYLYVETFNANGENWMALPKVGELRANLSADFDLVRYEERAIKDRGVAVVRLLARKKYR